MKYINIIAFIFFFGGIASIFTSINVKNKYTIEYDLSTNGIVTYISPIRLAFTYIYEVNNIIYFDGWLPNDIFENSSILVNYYSKNPNCSIIENIPGIQDNIFVGVCPYLYYANPWFWPFLMIIGSLFMCAGTIIASIQFFSYIRNIYI